MKPLEKLLLFLLFLSTSLFAQKAYFFSGIVKDNITQEPLEQAIIYVNRTPYTLDIVGEYRLYVQEGDTIIIGHLGYKAQQIIITDTMKEENLPKVIFLDRQNITLEEVEISSYQLTQEMKDNAQRTIQLAIQQSQQAHTFDYEDQYTTPPPTGTGFSSSQVVGANLFTLLKWFKKRKNKPKSLTQKHVMTYEEYMNTIYQNQVKDSLPK